MLSFSRALCRRPVWCMLGSQWPLLLSSRCWEVAFKLHFYKSLTLSTPLCQTLSNVLLCSRSNHDFCWLALCRLPEEATGVVSLDWHGRGRLWRRHGGRGRLHQDWRGGVGGRCQQGRHWRHHHRLCSGDKTIGCQHLGPGLLIMVMLKMKNVGFVKMVWKCLTKMSLILWQSGLPPKCLMKLFSVGGCLPVCLRGEVYHQVWRPPT